MKISYGLTVCNEHKEINNLIKYLLDRIDSEDEIIIVYDQNRVTQEVFDVFSKYQDKISTYPFDFKQNFLDNKNFMATKCTGEYIFQLDADEIPHEYLIKAIKSILKANPVEVLLTPRKNIVEGLEWSQAQKWGMRINEKGWVNWPDTQRRIYKNDPKIQWKGHQVHGLISGYDTYAALPKEEEYCIIHNKTAQRQEDQNMRYYNIEVENNKTV